MNRYRNRVYGRALQDLFEEEKGQQPAVLRQSIRFLNCANGLTTPSLFKLTGDGKKTQLIKDAWDQGRDPLKVTSDTYAVRSPVAFCDMCRTRKLGARTCRWHQSRFLQRVANKYPYYIGDAVWLVEDAWPSLVAMSTHAMNMLLNFTTFPGATTSPIGDIAAALRLWLSMLPDSVIPSALFSSLVAIHQKEIGLRRTYALQMFLRQVPQYVIKVLFPLLEFLHHYRLNQRRVNLPATDLAGIFAPLLLRPPKNCTRSPHQIEEERHIAISLTDTLICEYRTVLSTRNVLNCGLRASSTPSPVRQPDCSKALNTPQPHPGIPAGVDEAEADMDELVWSLVSGTTSNMLFEASDLPFARAVSSSFSTSSWSSLQTDLSGSDCSSPDSSYSQGCLSPSTCSESPSLSGGESVDMEWDASQDQALAPFLDAADEVCTSEPPAPAPWAGAGAAPGLMSLVPGCFDLDLDALLQSVDLDTWTMQQLSEEKAALKAQLKSIKTWFERVAGRSLHRREKAHLKPLYVRYERLKKALPASRHS